MIYKNFQSVLINGIDMYIKARFSNSAVSATISIIDPKDKTFNHQLEGSNKLSFNSSYIYFLKDDLSNININYRYISDTYYEDNNIPQYSIMNLSYNYKIFNKISISLGIDNLINTTAVTNRMTMYPDMRYYFTISFNNK